MDGEGGNVFHNITIAPPEGYLIGSNADGFHSTDVATGPTLSGSQLTNIENDFFSTHATMHIAVPLPEPRSHNFMLIDPREFAFGTAAAAGTIDEYYGTASPLNHVVNGTDTVSCYDFNSFAPIGQSVIGELKEVLTHHNLPLRTTTNCNIALNQSSRGISCSHSVCALLCYRSRTDRLSRTSLPGPAQTRPVASTWVRTSAQRCNHGRRSSSGT